MTKNILRVQIIENYLFYWCSELQIKYPTLYREIRQHDQKLFSSWYELSSKAYGEYERYINDGKCGNDYKQDVRYS